MGYWKRHFSSRAPCPSLEWTISMNIWRLLWFLIPLDNFFPFFSSTWVSYFRSISICTFQMIKVTFHKCHKTNLLIFVTVKKNQQLFRCLLKNPGCLFRKKTKTKNSERMWATICVSILRKFRLSYRHRKLSLIDSILLHLLALTITLTGMTPPVTPHYFHITQTWIGFLQWELTLALLLLLTLATNT